MQVKLTLRTSDGVETDVRIDAAQAAVAELAPLFCALTGQPLQAVVAAQGRPLPPGALLGGPGLRTASVLTIGSTPQRDSAVTSVLQMRVISGPDAGKVLALHRGVHTIGRSEDADIVLADPDISRAHARLDVDHRGVRIRDLSSTNGTCVRGSPVGEEPEPLDGEVFIRMGQSLLSVVGVNEPPAVTMPDGAGRVLVNRPPRVLRGRDVDVVVFPPEPTPSSRPKLHWLAMLVPAALSVVLAAGLHNIQFLAFALLTPISMLATTSSDRWAWRREAKADRARFDGAEAEAVTELQKRLAEEVTRRRREFPDPAAVMQSVSGPDCRLWERRTGDDDFLRVRFGVVDQVARTRATRSGLPLQDPVVTDVPATLDLSDAPLGMAGPGPLIRGVARWTIAQLLTLHAPGDLTIVALVDGDGEEWRWLRWLEASVSVIATDEDGHRQQVAMLAGVLAQRRTQFPTSRWNGPWTVLLIDPARLTATLPGWRDLLEAGPHFGITAVCVDEDARLLPPACRAVAHVVSETGAHIELVSSQPTTPTSVPTERVSLSWSETFARRLAPLRSYESSESSALPSCVSLTDLVFHGEPVTSDSLLQRWAEAGTVSTPIGVSAFGSIEIDLLRDGPHLLVAGSTGSGKSELLRTLVAGLACHHPPDEVSFVLIDYKGGAAFAECSDLPHVLALVTDLDGHLTGRALSSLEAELRRRESAFASLSVSDLADYRRHPDSAADPLPRLILVVDEFATLAEELPTFLTGLIGIAQRGRSLGVHLVLATQRPAGVVSPEIKANTALRIALRVTDPGESSDIVGSDAAARISQHTPGRAHARMAAGLVEFQTAVVGLPSHVGADLSIHPLDRWNRSIGADVDREPLPTDLQLITDAARIAADRLGRQLPSEPWMAPLGSVLVHPAVDEREDRYLLPLALADEPAAQRQVPVLFDLHSGGAIGFIGATRSGRTTALRSLAGRAAEQLTPDELHIHVIDCASNSLRLLAELPHCGTVVGREEPSLVSRLINLLRSEVARRHQLLAAFAPDARAQSRRFPRILVLLDGWEGLTASSDEHDAGSTTEAMLELLRDGPSAGFTFAVTGGRAALGTRLSSVLGHRYVLEMLDRNDFAAAGIPGKVVPNRFTPGRAVSTQTHLEVQLYLLAGEPSTAGQWAAIEKTARARADQHGLHRIPGPPRITVKQLPTRIEAVRIPSDSVPAGSIALGVGGDLAGTISIEMPARGSRFLISGPSRSGRSNAALQIATRAALAGMPVVVAAPARSPLSRWARRNAIPSIEPSATSQSLDAERALTEQRFAIFVIDDAEQFTDTAVGDLLLGVMQADGAAVVATARSEDLLIAFRGIAVEMGRSRTGLLLQPSVADGDLFGIRLPRTRYQPPPGRGLLITDSLRSVAPAGLPIQIAWADVESDYGVPLA